MPQAEVSFDIDWQGGWMHSYLYLDLNQNQQFDVTKIEDDELLLCTYYNPNRSNPKEGREKSAGILEQPNEWPYNSLKLETPFTAPKTPGVYRMRYKIDWNSLDPGGRVGADNDIAENRGNIVDFTLEVLDPKTASETELKPFNYELNVNDFKNGFYATMMVPFAVTLPEGVRAYSLNNTASTSAISFDRIDRRVIPANTPIFIAANTANTFNCTAAKNSEEPLVTNLEGSVVPFTQAMREEDKFKYFILIENKDKNAEFRRLERFTIPANRCHIRLPKEATATSLNISFPEAKPTGVVKVATETSTNHAIYNLAGQHIENTAAKGVVIVNGKKVVLP